MEIQNKPVLLASDRYFAVIDIGSNTVRLVVYSDVVRVPDVIFNEKSFVGLGSEVGVTGAMDSDSMDKAMAVLRRFKVLCGQMKVKHIHCFATAAVRDADNGATFVERVTKETGFDVDVIDGLEEARLAALGVVSGAPNITGIVGDLGGGSLELSRVEGGSVKDCVSLPIGPLRLLHEFEGNTGAIEEAVKAAILSVPWIKDVEGKNLFMVGGSWRNIARLMLLRHETPIAILHNYKISAKSLHRYVSKLADKSPSDLDKHHSITKKRRAILPTAALILSRLIDATNVTSAIVSSNGVREGVIYDRLDEHMKNQDPFVVAAETLANERCRFPEHGKLLYNWTRVLYPNLKQERPEIARLHYVSCVLSDIAWRAHPDFKAERAVEIITHGRWLGISHKERAYVAVTLNAVYGEHRNAGPIKDARQALDKVEEDEARSLGFAIRLAQRLSGGSLTALDVSRLTMDDDTITLWIDNTLPDLVSSIVNRRLKALKRYFKRDTNIRFEA